MKKFSIKTQAEFDECLMWISCLSKDAYGFRMRGRSWSTMSFEELAAEVNSFQDVIDRDLEMIDEGIRIAEQLEEEAIQKCLAAGAEDKDQARRWLDDAS